MLFMTVWETFIEPDGLQMTIWRTRIACWIPKATNTHSQYVLLIAFPLHHSLHERASMLRYTYMAYPVPITICICFIVQDVWTQTGGKLYT